MSDDDAADVAWLVEAGADPASAAVRASLAAALTAAGPDDTFPLQPPCRRCNGEIGRAVERNGQDVIYCAGCGTATGYNRPKSESGKARRSLRSRANVSPSMSARIFARFHNRCWVCGRQAGDGLLVVDHLVPLAAAQRWGFDQAWLDAEWNMAPACEEHNAGRAGTLARTSFAALLAALEQAAVR